MIEEFNDGLCRRSLYGQSIRDSAHRKGRR